MHTHSNAQTHATPAATAVNGYARHIDRLSIRTAQLKGLADALIVCTTHAAGDDTCESLRFLVAELAADVCGLVDTIDASSVELCGLAMASATTGAPDNLTRLPGSFELVPAGADAGTPATGDAHPLHVVQAGAEPTTGGAAS